MPEVTIKHTPAELAAMFGALDNHAQAEFFNALAAYIDAEYDGDMFGFALQMEDVRRLSFPEGPALNADGMCCMRIIGGNY